MPLVHMMQKISLIKPNSLLISVFQEQLIVVGSIINYGLLALALLDQHQQVQPLDFVAMIQLVLLTRLTSASKMAILLRNLK